MKLWLTLFGVWALFLSGWVSPLTGTPGVTQALRLKSLAAEREARVIQLRGDIRSLQADAVQLEKNRFIQQREIRSVLGYAAPDEVVFDFSNPNNR